MITPFTADGANVDWPVLDSLIEWYVEEDDGMRERE
jgi:dihydrodipicolinate synthase/N-acetylneuraminate lyase